MGNGAESSLLYRKALGCMLGGLIGDAIGTPTEGKDYRSIERELGWVSDFESDGTDDTVMKNLLGDALVRTDGYADLDDWAEVWLDRWDDIFSSKVAKFYISVLHTAHKLRRHALPREAALGNMPSSSSAMCISPVGIVNACNPRQAAIQAYNLASLIHVQDVSFCQDGAAAMAAAVAEAMKPSSTPASVLDASTRYLQKTSGREMIERVERALALARESPDYRLFRATVYSRPDSFFCRINCDSRETVPLALALFCLADGDVEATVTFGANFGRDADTIASMAGAVAGALSGVDGIRPDWVEKADRYAAVKQAALARQLVEVAVRRANLEREAIVLLESIC